MITISLQTILSATAGNDPIEVKAHYLNDFDIVEDILEELNTLNIFSHILNNMQSPDPVAEKILSDNLYELV